MTLPRILPWHLLRHRWTESEQIKAMMTDYRPAPFGRIRKLRGTLIALDASYNRDGSLHSVHVARLTDHPFLKELPANTPRVVRSLYRKEKRLAHLKATDAFVTGREMRMADEAWEKYLDETGL